ncbi:MAG TPA: branched-chain amino acid transport system II carrier protein [Sphingobacteriaceae bacterium]|nr:branched-chain amino acid transport system II carrier protein [Sphingobacteriaceae bacterium]
MNRKNKDILTIGFALFAMFFGAGNLLLPPYLGIQVGSYVWVTIFAFSLTGILLPFLGVLSVVQSGQSITDLGARVHPYLSPILGSIIVLCIGPLIAIPRTAATTYEVGILPSFPNFSPILASILFFTVAWILTIRPSKVVDIIGNILTPVLLVLLLLLIVVGVVFVQGDYGPTDLTSMEAFSLGFIEGYQTLDVMASVIFAGIIISSATDKGYTERKSKIRVVTYSGLLATFCLFIIYGGLLYLGATSGVSDLNIGRSALLIHITQSVLGDYGLLAIAISIALACLTTAIALTSAFGIFFNNLFNGKVGYKTLVTICCVISAILAVNGVDNIIQFAYPPLAFVYPVVITLVLYIVILGPKVKRREPYIGALIGSTIIGFFSLLKVLGLLSPTALSVLDYIPLFSIDLGWIVPSLIGFFIGLAVARKSESPKSSAP